MLPDDLRKAVEYMDDLILHYEHFDSSKWTAIKAHLLAREAENARLRRMLGECYAMAGADTDGDPPERHAVDALAAVTQLRVDYDESCGWQDRAERAEALLRECLVDDVLAIRGVNMPSALRRRITAHLSENSRG